MPLAVDGEASRGPEQDDTAAAPGSVTQLIRAHQDGDAAASERLAERVYAELSGIAARRLGAGAARLQPADLVQEAWLRLLALREARFTDRRHFVAVAARAMRHALIDADRKRRAQKRGGGALPVELRTWDEPARDDSGILAADLEDALAALAAEHPEPARLVELRFYGGLSPEEAAAELGLGRVAADRAWRFARAWLHGRLVGEDGA